MRNDAETFAPLGPAKPKPGPAPQPEWKPTGTPGVEINAQGQRRTNKPENELANGLPPMPFTFYGTALNWRILMSRIKPGCM
jgi:hypothetical protein